MQEMVEQYALMVLVREKLQAHGIISSAQEVSLQPIHSFLFQGRQKTHFIIRTTSPVQIFFLKAVKDADGALFCDEFLRKMYRGKENCPFPLILVPKFKAQGMEYYITTFLAGVNLDHLSAEMTVINWEQLADKLLSRLHEMASIHAPQYSERDGFFSGSCGTALIRKLQARVRHPLLSCFPQEQVKIAVSKYSDVLTHSSYSLPTLLHMDIKPANIIYNPQTKDISVVDFEFARFGDMDYGWIQILLSGINLFSPMYQHVFVPRLTRDYLPLSEAVNIPKLRAYSFYQCLCNLIYYYDHHLQYPEKISALFEQLLSNP